MKIYDDVLNYIDETIELSFDYLSPEEAKEYAVCHIGCMLTWLIKNDFTNFSSDLTCNVLNKTEFGSSFILNNCDGKMNSSDLKDEIIPFMDEFYPNYFKVYSKVVAGELKNLPLEYIVTYDDYEKIEFIFNDAYNEFSGGTAGTNELDKALEFFEAAKYEEALVIFTKLAERKNEIAASKLGFMYLKGIGVKKDKDKAIEYYDQSVGRIRVDFKTVVTGTNIPLLLDYAEVIKTDDTFPWKSIATQYIERAAVLGDIVSLRKVATDIYNSGYSYRYGLASQTLCLDLRDVPMPDGGYNGAAIEWFQLGARRYNDIYCQYMVGQCYYNSNQITTNYSRALKWYNIAANNGHHKAMCMAGQCYQFGRGTDIDKEKALSLYEEAYNKGDIEAGYYAATIYKEQDNYDENKIIELIKNAVASGNVEAQRDYANYLLNGIGVDKNETLAIEYYKKAAEAQDATACYVLAVLYEEGSVLPQDIMQAQRYYKQCVSSIHDFDNKVDALIRYANICINTENYSEPFDMYIKAIELGSQEAFLRLQVARFKTPKYYVAESHKKEAYTIISDLLESNELLQYEIGMCYLEGTGVEVNIDEAIRLLTLAAKAGIEEAKSKVKEAKLKKLENE